MLPTRFGFHFRPGPRFFDEQESIMFPGQMILALDVIRVVTGACFTSEHEKSYC